MNLLNFETALKNAKTTAELDHALKNYLHSFSVESFAFTYYSYHPNSTNKIKYDFYSANFEIWHKHYISEGYENIDSTLEVVYHTNLPVYWELEQQLKNAKTLRERQMRLDSIAFGAEKGLCIPIHGPQEDFAILLLVQMQGQKCLENWQLKQHDFFCAAHYYYVYLQKLILVSKKLSQKKKLSHRELQCLTLVAKQYSIPKIATTLNITERTVNYHIQKLNKKLGTKNKYQSVIKALEQNLIAL